MLKGLIFFGIFFSLNAICGFLFWSFFNAICSNWELETAIPLPFIVFWSLNLSFSMLFTTFGELDIFNLHSILQHFGDRPVHVIGHLQLVFVWGWSQVQVVIDGGFGGAVVRVNEAKKQQSRNAEKQRKTRKSNAKQEKTQKQQAERHQPCVDGFWAYSWNLKNGSEDATRM